MGSPAFLFLCRLAWAARYRIPLIISVVFIAFDIHMQVEINVEMRAIRHDHVERLPSIDDDNLSEGSWVTIEENETLTFDEEETEIALVTVEA